MYCFIINPRSKSRKGMEIWRSVQEELLIRRIPYRYFFTKYRGHAQKLAAQISRRLSKEDILAVIGGDGTMNEVINGLSYPVPFALGYIPTGSGNDFARGMNIPSTPEQALNLLLNPVCKKKMDIGCIASDTRKRLFGISSGIGFDASICYEALSSPIKHLLNKLHLGKLTYAVIAIKQLLFFQTSDMELLLDDNSPLTLKDVYFTAVMNQSYEGGGFSFCPRADSGDGYLDIIAVAGLPKWKVLILFPIAYFGKHTNIKGIHILKCRQISLKSNRKYHIHVDGEFMGMHSDLTASILPYQLDVITR